MSKEQKSTTESMVDYFQDNSVGLLVGGFIVLVLLGALAFKDRMTGLPPDLERRSQEALDAMVQNRQEEIDEQQAVMDEEAAIAARQTTTTFRLAEADFQVRPPKIKTYDPTSRGRPPLGGSADGGDPVTPTTDGYASTTTEAAPEPGSIVTGPVEETVWIENRLTGFCLTATEELNVLQTPCGASSDQEFTVEPLEGVEDGVRLRAGETSNYLEVQRGLFNDEEVDGEPFNNISVWEWLGVEMGQQVFRFRWADNSAVRIEPAGYDRCVATADPRAVEWGNVIHQPCVPFDTDNAEEAIGAQSWFLRPVQD